MADQGAEVDLQVEGQGGDQDEGGSLLVLGPMTPGTQAGGQECTHCVACAFPAALLLQMLGQV